MYYVAGARSGSSVVGVPGLASWGAVEVGVGVGAGVVGVGAVLLVVVVVEEVVLEEEEEEVVAEAWV